MTHAKADVITQFSEAISNMTEEEMAAVDKYNNETIAKYVFDKLDKNLKLEISTLRKSNFLLNVMIESVSMTVSRNKLKSVEHYMNHLQKNFGYF
jgi:6-pyruvoyl-tetrahydropterin synthase